MVKDEEVRDVKENEDKLHVMAEALMEFETLSSEQIDDIMAGAKPRISQDSTGGSNSSGDSSSAGESPIGGPAEET